MRFFCIMQIFLSHFFFIPHVALKVCFCFFLNDCFAFATTMTNKMDIMMAMVNCNFELNVCGLPNNACCMDSWDVSAVTDLNNGK